MSINTLTRRTGVQIAEEVLRGCGWNVTQVRRAGAVHLLAEWEDERRLAAVVTTSKDGGWLATPRLDGAVSGNVTTHAALIEADPWVIAVDVRPEIADAEDVDRQVRWEELRSVVQRLSARRTNYVNEAPDRRSHDGLFLGLRVLDLALPIR